MDKKLNTEEASLELKKALTNTKGSRNPNMSEAEAKMKFQGKK
jgi:hypothetical protein